MSSFSATVQLEIEAQQTEVFEHIVPVDLTSIFTGYGPLPAVTETRNQTGPWNAAGQTRTVVFSDGSSAKEHLTGYENPQYFSYTLSGFTGFLGLLATSAMGEWWFNTDSTSCNTLVKWHYSFHSRSVITAPVLLFIVKGLWRGYMRKALMISKAQIEGRATQQVIESQHGSA